MAVKVTGDGGKAARAAALEQRRPARQTKPAPGTVTPQRVPVRAAGPDDDAAMEPTVFEFQPITLAPLDKTKIPRVHLFTVNGTKYTMPAEVGTEISLRANHAATKLRLRGVPEEQVDYATLDVVLEAMLGEEGHQALITYDGLDPAQFAQIVAILYRVVYGALEVPKDAGSE